MSELLISAFLAGLVGSPHCIGMCGGFASACASSPRSTIAWNSGRLTTYAVLGAIVGTMGHVMPGPSWIPAALSLVLLVWFAGSLAGVLPKLSFRVPGLTRIGGRLFKRTDFIGRYAFGMATGLLPCGFLYFGLTFAIAAASPWVGALSMVAFGLGTIPALAFLSGAVHRFATQGLWARRTLALLVLSAGLWAIAVRTFGHTMMH